MNTKLKNIGTLAFAALLAGTTAFGVAGAANAQPHKQKAAAATVTEQAPPAGDNAIDEAIRASNGSDFAIVSQAQLSSGLSADIKSTTSASELQGIRAAISANPALASKITGQNIEIKEITGATKAADGSLVFYTM
ncbi:hypothetical protein [Rhizobium sp. C1]|uniref:hypothetical protein n=1 Tax=Rhizobium sp. C1 TaxID=1349799 RepID=UPI001E309D9D|nr:hypothetical protein [Rhizobium sp. C1]MCD2177262.1 hypothetical protein [Rhizobium sp. C1]